MSEDNDPDLLLSELYHCLRASRRRVTIQYMSNRSNSKVPTTKLARIITGSEYGIVPEKATGEPYRNTYNALSQTHLPVLSDANIICYDCDRQMVTGGPNLAVATLLLTINKSIIETIKLMN